MYLSDVDALSLRNWTASPLVIAFFALLLRYAVSLWPYSGQAESPLHGDYEAQRHWMEITTALPIHLWYRYTVCDALRENHFSTCPGYCDCDLRVCIRVVHILPDRMRVLQIIIVTTGTWYHN